MFGFGKLCFSRPLGYEEKQEKLYRVEKTKAEKKMKILDKLLSRQAAKNQRHWQFEVFGCHEMIGIYSNPKNFDKISIEDRCKGLQRLNREMCHYEEQMLKTKLATIPWIMEKWRNHQENRDRRRSEVRQQKEYFRRIDAPPSRRTV